MSAPYNLMEELYRLVSEMTVSNDYSFDWATAREWENGGAIMQSQPILHIKDGKLGNDDSANGVGNNFLQLNVPIEIMFGKTLDNPSDEFLSTTQQLNQLNSLMAKDVRKMFASPFKVNMANVPEYCGSEYSGDGDVPNVEDLGAYTVVASMEFDITYKESRGIND